MLSLVNVTRTEVVRSYILYQVHGLQPDGTPCPTIQTFESLSPGEQELDLELDPKNPAVLIARLPGRSRAARVPASNGGGSDIEARLARLEKQMRAMIGNAEVPLP